MVDSTPLSQSIQETKEHIGLVRELMGYAVGNLEDRAIEHDMSKLESPEMEAFAASKAKLAAVEFGSPEYEKAKASLGPALDHHYAANSHHPEYFKNGIDDMSLFDLVEMLMDWKASTARMKNGDIRKSLLLNSVRFKMTPQLESIFRSTIDEMGW